MSWPSFLAAPWAFMGLLAIPLIALYLLRQRRPNQDISSTLLWSKTLADMRASTPFQKLRRNLLLLLQLLILAALVLTLMRPVIQATASQSSAGIIVIDATASMQTRDGREGAGGWGGDNPTRLDRAKDEAKKLIQSMRPGDRFKVLADGGGLNRIGNDFMTSKSELLRVIDSIQASDTPSDLSESLLLAAESLRAASGNNAANTGKIWLFSDGAGVRVPDILGGNAPGATSDLLQFVRIGTSDHSVGITRLSVTSIPKEDHTYEVFVGLQSAWNVEKKVGVLLAYGSKDAFLPDQAKFVTLPPGGQGGVVFEKVTVDLSSGQGKLFVRVDDTDDDFPLDNTAYAILTPPRKVHVVLVTRGNDVLERFIATAARVGGLEGQIVVPENYSPSAPADLFIFDGFVPPATNLPKVDSLFVRPIVSGQSDVAGFKISHTIDNPAILSWKREDPLLQSVNFAELHIGKALLMDRDPAAVELVSSPEGPLIAYKDFGNVRRYLISFSPLLESDWWRDRSLLIFLQNIVDQTRLRHFIGMPQLVAAGSPAKLWNVGGETGEGGGELSSVQVALPDGSIAKVPVKEGAAEFADTDQTGFYEVSSGSKKSLFAVNLLSPSESNIRPQSLHSSSGSSVAEVAGVTTVNKEIWPWVATAALVILLIEWWIYHRRIA